MTDFDAHHSDDADPARASVRADETATGAWAAGDIPEGDRPAPDDGRPLHGGANSPADLVRLADSSDALLTEVRQLREVEERKRRTSVSTPEFHRLAQEVEERALRIWSAANEERVEGDRLETEPGTTTQDGEAIKGPAARPRDEGE